MDRRNSFDTILMEHKEVEVVRVGLSGDRNEIKSKMNVGTFVAVTTFDITSLSSQHEHSRM